MISSAKIAVTVVVKYPLWYWPLRKITQHTCNNPNRRRYTFLMILADTLITNCCNRKRVTPCEVVHARVMNCSTALDAPCSGLKRIRAHNRFLGSLLSFYFYWGSYFLTFRLDFYRSLGRQPYSNGIYTVLKYHHQLRIVVLECPIRLSNSRAIRWARLTTA